jgi:RNA polymerase sigma-70 factor (ECF subfamily)
MVMSFTAVSSQNDSERTKEFLRLLGSHEERTNAYIFSLVPHWADAQDIIQEVRIRLWEQFDHYDATKDFGVWARTIAYYQVLAYRKTSSRCREQLGLESLELVAKTFDTNVRRFELRSSVMRKCIQKLTAAKRRILLRCYSGHETIRQVAESLGRSFETVRKSVFRTRNQLATCIRQELKDEESSS